MKGHASDDRTTRECLCLWMNAGVINFRICDCDYDCRNCPFERAMRNTMDAQEQPMGREPVSGWSEGMRKKYPGGYKPCRYFLNGQLGPPGMCRRNYDCEGCPIDIFFEYGSQFGAVLESTPRIRSQSYAEQSIQNPR